MKTNKWLRTIPVACLLSSALLTVPTSSFAAIDISSCTKKDYPQSCVEQTDPGVNNRTHEMYETINRLVAINELNEQTNWSGKNLYNFIRFNYLILPSQEQDVLNQLNIIPKDNVGLKQVLKALNGYHNRTNIITDTNTIQISNMNVNTYIEDPKPEPNSDQYREINTKVINESYSQTLTKKTQNITESIQSSKQLTVTHSLNTGTKEGLKSSFGVGVPLIGEVKGEFLFEYSANLGYTNASLTINTTIHTVTSPQEDISLAPRTGAVVIAKLSTPVYTTNLLGISRIKGYYTDQVNNYPTWVQLGIYNKFKVISQHNPTIWNKLKELGFFLDDQTKEVIFNGRIDLIDRHAPGSTFESRTQIYELDENGNINYNKPVGKPQKRTSSKT
ncbi:hypothetical protein PDJ95_27915 [Bacillus cereus]|nr:hypothetical protein [Bacillus cereus]